LVIGCTSGGNSSTYLNASSVQNFLPQTAPASVLSQSFINPPKNPTNSSQSNGGSLAGNLLALSLNLGFDNCPSSGFSLGCSRLASLFVCDSGQQFFFQQHCDQFFGLTIQQIFQYGNSVLGNCCQSLNQNQCDIGVVNLCLTAINAAFTPSGGSHFLTQRFSHNEFSTLPC